MAAVTAGRGKSAVSWDVTFSGPFFLGSPVKRLHRNAYTILREEGEYGALAAGTLLRGRQTQFGAGYPNISMADEIRWQPARMRYGKARLKVSANYGPHPLVRKYSRWIEDASTNRPRGGFAGYRIFREAARMTQAHINGRISQIAATLTKGLT